MEYLISLAVYLAVIHSYPLRTVVWFDKSCTVNVVKQNNRPGGHWVIGVEPI